MNLNANQIYYGLIKEENFAIVLWKNWLDNNNISMYSTHNEGKSVVAEEFIKTLMGKIYKKWRQITANLILVIQII